MIRQTILALTIAGLSLFSISAFAATPTPAVTDSTAMSIPLNGQFKVKKACRNNAFDGLNISAAQRACLDKTVTNRDSVLRTNMLRLNAQKKKMRRICDSTHSASRTLYLKEIKDILTPEQYMTFLENSYVDASTGGRAHMKSKASKASKAKHCHKKHRKHKS